MTQTSRERYGWAGTLSAFLSLSQEEWLQALEIHHRRCMNMVADAAQQQAWKHCFMILQTQYAALLQQKPQAATWTCVFEYELPRERGRRPDVLLFAGSRLFILEFKDTAHVQCAHVDQVADYARDLQQYHAASHHLSIFPVLVLTLAKTTFALQSNVSIVSPNQLVSRILSLTVDDREQPVNPATWLKAEYAPLPSLVEAARTIFQHEPLPTIRRAQSAGIPEAVRTLIAIGQRAHHAGERHVALLTGVPGAGKTLVGLQLVYTTHGETSPGERSAVFLSGNGPLVKVLQHALKNRVFVQDVHGFLKEYGGNQQRLPEEHIWVYDEAQRAWDATRVQELRGHGTSEPEDFLRLGQRMPSWAFLIGLIGEGQEIYLGEEGGIPLWDAAMTATGGSWIVHCPPKLAHQFSQAKLEVHGTLDLTVSLRSHVAEDVHQWISLLLEGRLQEAAQLVPRIQAQGFHLYITQNVQAAKQYVREKYSSDLDKRYGLLASSRATNLKHYGIDNDYMTARNIRIGPWYNDPPTSAYSCCQLDKVVREFDCQGLELDFPLVAWGNDLTWQQNTWKSMPMSRGKAHDPHRLRLNSYRVLLSRGRDGFIIFVPPESSMRQTYQALLQAGLPQL